MSIPPLISTRPRTAFDRISLYFQTYIYIYNSTGCRTFCSPSFRSNLINRFAPISLTQLLIQVFFFFRKVPNNYSSRHSVLFVHVNRCIIIRNLFHFAHKDDGILFEVSNNFFNDQLSSKYRPISFRVVNVPGD